MIFILLSSVPLSVIFMGFVCVKNPSNLKKYLPIYVFIMAVIAYSITPNYVCDLTRYFEYMDYCRTLPIQESLSWADDGLIVKNFLFWFIGHLDDNHLLPALAVGSLYGVTAYIAIDSAKENKRNLYIVLLLQICMLPLFEATSNVRNMLAFSLIILAVYRDLVKKNLDILTIVLYIAPCFIHMTGIVIILIRISTIVAKRYPKITVISMVALPTMTIELYEHTLGAVIPGNIGKIITRAINKAYSSTLSTSVYAETMKNSGYVNACRLVTFIFLIAFIYLIFIYLKEKHTEYKNFVVFCLILSCITVVWILLQAVKYWVFAVSMVISSGPVLSYFILNYKKIGSKARIAIMIITIMAILRLGLEIYFISDRIYIAEFFSGIMLTNAYTMLYHIVTGLFHF